MASDKKRRKQTSADRKARRAALPPKPPKDGDRRRRTGYDMVREVLKAKQKARDWTIDDAPIDLPTEPDA
jgi:hypothetical protein